MSPTNLSNGPIFVEADEVRIFQVISNLLCNAIKFTDKQSISISIERRREVTEAAAPVENEIKEEVIVSIRDSGVGIPPEISDRLFSKFATKSETGTGLRLFISKRIVEAHGGKIWAQNNADGRGATFAFSIPLSKTKTGSTVE